jgi:alpha-D-ribose 1-methylphosphonate 5-triphosphate diphosphatase
LKRQILTNAHIITPLKNFSGSLIIENKNIADVIENKRYIEGDDLRGSWLIPGIVDIHSDYLEREINPRPNTGFPLSAAFRHLDLRAATSGITSLFNAISFMENEEYNRSVDRGMSTSRKLDEYISSGYFLIRHFLHARLDTTHEKIVEAVDDIISLRSLKLAVYNDHTPGRRQFRDMEKYSVLVAERSGKTIDEVKSLIAVRQKKAKDVRAELSEKLKERVLIGSHDDVTEEHIEEAIRYGVNLCEFPTTLEAARCAKKKGLIVAMGAPNLILGRSNSGNLSCGVAMEENLVDIFCSDYHFPAMLLSAMMLIRKGRSPSQAINLMTLNPARAVGLDKETGSIEVGKKADLIVFDVIDNQPVIRQLYVDGVKKFSCLFSGKKQLEVSV